MKNYLFLFIFLLFSMVFFSCAEIKPVTIGGVENPVVKTLSTAGADFTFGMKILNPNTMGVTIYPTAFDAMVSGIDIGKIKLDKRVRIKSNSNSIPEFHIKSNFSKLGMADVANVISMVASKRATVSLKGDVKVGHWYYKKKFPVEFTKSISLAK